MNTFQNQFATNQSFLALEEQWSKAHGEHSLVKKSVFDDLSGVPIIVSTAIIMAGFDQQQGVFTTIETRVFGGQISGSVIKKRFPGIVADVSDLILEQHFSVLKEILGKNPVSVLH